jgi:hypothetical protein
MSNDTTDLKKSIDETADTGDTMAGDLDYDSLYEKSVASMDEFREEGDLPTVNEALRAATKGVEKPPDKPPGETPDETTTVVTTSAPFAIIGTGVEIPVPSGSYILGELVLTEDLPAKARVLDQWTERTAPHYAPLDGDHIRLDQTVPADSDPLRVVSGAWFGRDATVAIISHILTMNPNVITRGAMIL